MLKFKYHSIVQLCSIVFLVLFFLQPIILHAATRTSAVAGNWGTTTTWGGASVPGASDNVTVNHALNLNSDLTINSGGTYTFNASNSGGAPNITMGDHFLVGGGTLNINSPAVVTMASVDMYYGTIHVANGATLIITGNFDNSFGTIVVDAGGTLTVGGDFSNLNADITDNGTITVGGDFSSYSTFLTSGGVTGTGTITSGGSMTNSGFGNSTIFGSGSNCNTGPCSGRCLTGMTTGAITVGSPGLTTFCSGATTTTFTTPAVTGATIFSWTLPVGFTITSTPITSRSITVSIAATASSGNVTVQASSSTCTGNVSTLAVTVGKPAGTAVVSGSSPVCQNTSQVYTVTGVTNATSYAWTVTGATIASGAGTAAISVNMGTTASVPISVIPSNACGNATGVTLGSKAVTVSLTNAATIAYSSNYCTSLITAQTPTRTGTTGGVYSYTSSPAGGTLGSFNTSTGSFIPATSSTSQTFTVTYTMAATGCAAATATASPFTIGVPAGTAVISGASPVCQGSSQVYAVSGTTGATNYTWTVPLGASIASGAGTSSITVTMGTASGPVSVIPSNTCGIATGSAIGSKTVTVNLTNAATIAYPSASYFCTGTTAAQVPTIIGITGGTFTKTTGTLTSFGGSTGSFVPNGSTAGTYTITYAMPATACPAGTATTSITVSSIIPSGAATITGNAAVCQNTSNTYTVGTTVTGATGYNWSVPSGASITAGAGTNSITVLMGTTSGTVSVVPYNGCGNATGTTLSSKAITVNIQPAATIAYPINGSYGALYCSNTTTTQIPTITGTTGGTFTKSAGTLASFNAVPATPGSFVPNGSTANTTFTITYTMTAPAGCINATATTTVKIATASPALGASTTPTSTSTPTTLGTNPCPNTIGLGYKETAVTNASTTGYIWTLPSGAAITAGTGSTNITVTMGNISGNITVTPTRSSDGCIGNTSSPLVITMGACAITWVGGTSNAWNTGANWSPATVPGNTNNVTIPAVTSPKFNPVISTAAANVASLTINSGGVLTNSGTLNNYGNLTNSAGGIFTANSGSTVAFLGTTAQTISGVPTLYNTTLNNTSSTGLSVSSALVIKGKLALTDGALTTNSNLTVDIDNGGNIGYASGDVGTISGDVTVFRAINSGTTHYISCPLDGVTVNDLADNAEVINPVTTKTRLFQFDNAGYVWAPVSDLDATMSPGSSFSMWFPAATTVDFTGTYTHSATYSYAAPNVATKFMFVSNPYPSTLDWDAAAGWTKSGVNSAIYFWNPASNSYSSYITGAGTNSATRYIPAMNSFFVAYNGSSPATATVAMDGRVRTSTFQSMWRVASDETVRLTLKSATATDETVIRFNEDATNEFDGNLDAFKMMNGSTVPSIYTMFGSTKYSINSIASPDAKDTVPVFTKIPADGEYVLGIKSSDPTIEYILIDKKLGTEKAISTGDYAFTALKTDSINRFDLQMRQVVTTGVQQASATSAMQILSSPNGFLVKSGVFGIGSIEILDVTGNRVNVLKDVSLVSGNNFFTPALSDGIYLVKVTIADNSYMGQVSIVK